MKHGAYPLAIGISYESVLCCGMIVNIYDMIKGDFCCMRFYDAIVDAYVSDGGWMYIHHWFMDWCLFMI